MSEETRWLLPASSLNCPHPQVLCRFADLHHGEKHHAGDTNQGDLAGLESNTSAVGATGGRGDGSTGGGNDCRLEGS